MKSLFILVVLLIVVLGCSEVSDSTEDTGEEQYVVVQGDVSPAIQKAIDEGASQAEITAMVVAEYATSE